MEVPPPQKLDPSYLEVLTVSSSTEVSEKPEHNNNKIAPAFLKHNTHQTTQEEASMVLPFITKQQHLHLFFLCPRGNLRHKGLPT